MANDSNTKVRLDPDDRLIEAKATALNITSFALLAAALLGTGWSIWAWA